MLIPVGWEPMLTGEGIFEGVEKMGWGGRGGWGGGGIRKEGGIERAVGWEEKKKK